MAPPRNGRPWTDRPTVPVGASVRRKSRGSLRRRLSSRGPVVSRQVRVASPPYSAATRIGSLDRMENRDAGCPGRPLWRRTGCAVPRRAGSASSGSIQDPRGSTMARAGDATGTSGSPTTALPANEVAVAIQQANGHGAWSPPPHGAAVDARHGQDLPGGVGEEGLVGGGQRGRRKAALGDVDPRLARQADHRLAGHPREPFLRGGWCEKPATLDEEQVARRPFREVPLEVEEDR